MIGDLERFRFFLFKTSISTGLNRYLFKWFLIKPLTSHWPNLNHSVSHCHYKTPQIPKRAKQAHKHPSYLSFSFPFTPNRDIVLSLTCFLPTYQYLKSLKNHLLISLSPSSNL